MPFSITEQERDQGKVTAEKLAAIVHDVETIGYAVVSDLVTPATCQLLAEAILEDVAEVRALATPTRHETNTGQGHLQLGLRRRAPYVRADLIANPLIEHIVSAVLGANAWLGFYNGNVNLPGSVHQPLHYDRPFSWRTQEEAEQDGQRWPPPTTTLSCSVALTEITEDNGATEIYPGTHLETEVTKWPLGERVSKHPELIEKWQPPARMPIPAGGICFRDPRMWHRGVPNPSDQVRPMIALTYHSARCLSWRGRMLRRLPEADKQACTEDQALKVLDDGTLADGRLVFDDDVSSVFAIPSPHGINRNVRFVSSPERVNHFLDAHERGGARVVTASQLSPRE